MYTLQICLAASATPEDTSKFLTAAEKFYKECPTAGGGVLRVNASALNPSPYSAMLLLTGAGSDEVQLTLATVPGRELNMMLSGLHKEITIMHLEGSLR